MTLSKRGRPEGPSSLWRSIPLECFASAFAVILAAALKLSGLTP